MVRPSASTSAGRSVASTAASRATASGPVPMPGPATQAWTRPTDPGRSQSPSSGCTVSTASGQVCRTTAAGTLAVTTRTMPAPPRTAPPVAGTAAPVLVRLRSRAGQPRGDVVPLRGRDGGLPFRPQADVDELDRARVPGARVDEQARLDRAERHGHVGAHRRAVDGA